VAAGIRGGADDYAAQILSGLEQEVAKALAGIRKGIEVLDDRKADLREAAGAGDNDNGAGDGDLDHDQDDADEREGSRPALTR